MLSKFVLPGDKVELQEIGQWKDNHPEAEKKIYCSRVHDILDEDRMEITMPMEKTKLLLLQVDEEYDMVLYSGNGLYQCFVRIVDRYKSNNVFLLQVELTSNLRKFQRREFYRYSCALEMSARLLSEEEVQRVEERGVYSLDPGLPLKRSIIVDISGGGLRFIADYKCELDSLVYCNYQLLLNGQLKEYHLVGKVLMVREAVNKPGVYEHRIQYMNINLEEREEIIKYIFQEERKSRKRENGF